MSIWRNRVLMMDTVTKTKRSWIMSKVRRQNTAPEIRVRSQIHRMGFRFRVAKKGLPGTPDVVLPRHKKVIFVHGCFWHQHPGCRLAKRPGTNLYYWNAKFEDNIARDRRNEESLTQAGWKILVLWTCEIKDGEGMKEKLVQFLEPNRLEQVTGDQRH